MKAGTRPQKGSRVGHHDDLQIVEVEAPGGALRAAAYARVSTPKQTTIPSQIRICRNRAEEKGWNVKYILKDQAYQGTDLERPAFQRLLDLAEREAIDVVVVWKLDRLARSLSHAVSLQEFLSEHGVGIHSCTEPVDTTTSIGRFVFGNLANAAQLERDMIRERISMGMFSRALEGRWPQSRVPLGYRKTRGQRLRVDRREAEIVRAVFQTYRKYPSYAEVAVVLNADKVPYRRGKWTADRVRQTLENSLYCGRYCMSGVRKVMPHLAIVTPNLFDEIATIRAAALRKGQPASKRLRDAAIDAVFTQYFECLRRDDVTE